MNAKGGPAVAYTEQRLASIASAIPLTTDKTVIEANALMATALASQIKLLPLQIKTQMIIIIICVFWFPAIVYRSVKRGIFLCVFYL